MKYIIICGPTCSGKTSLGVELALHFNGEIISGDLIPLEKMKEQNDVLIVILSAGGTWTSMAYYVCMTVIGSVTGCFFLFMVGRKGGRAILKKRFSEQKIERAEKTYNKYGILAVLIPSILPPPLPFKIFVLSAGVFGMPVTRFLSAVAIGRTIRYSMWGILAVLYGNSVKLFLENNISTVGQVIAAVVLLAVIGTIVFYLRKKKRRKKCVENASIGSLDTGNDMSPPVDNDD